MPSPSRSLTAGDAHTFVRGRALPDPNRPANDRPLVGVELEWHTSWRHDPLGRVAPTDLRALIARVLPLPRGGHVTLEPGGQIELSTRPFPSVARLIEAAQTDATVLRAALAEAGVVTTASAVDTRREPLRVLDEPRYAAMETYFERWAPFGRTMMCNTAAIQLNVGFNGDPAAQWRAAHTVAAAMSLRFGGDERRAIWAGIDPSRTQPVGGDEPGEAWARYALDAAVMFVRVAPDRCIPMVTPMTFGGWIEHGSPWGWPTVADLDEHLTTLFPPVRPRGWLEIRTLDMLDDDLWPVAVEATARALLDVGVLA